MSNQYCNWSNMKHPRHRESSPQPRFNLMTSWTRGIDSTPEPPSCFYLNTPRDMSNKILIFDVSQLTSITATYTTFVFLHFVLSYTKYTSIVKLILVACEGHVLRFLRSTHAIDQPVYIDKWILLRFWWSRRDIQSRGGFVSSSLNIPRHKLQNCTVWSFYTSLWSFLNLYY